MTFTSRTTACNARLRPDATFLMMREADMRRCRCDRRTGTERVRGQLEILNSHTGGLRRMNRTDTRSRGGVHMETRPETEPEVPIRGGQIWRSKVREITVLNGYHRVIHQTRKSVPSAQLDGRIGLRISSLSRQEIPNQRMLQRVRWQIRRGLEVTRYGISCRSRSTGGFTYLIRATAKR